MAPTSAVPFGPETPPRQRRPADGLSPSDLIAIAFTLANEAVISDIESEGVKVMQYGMTWYDIRPMLDSREHAEQVIDMAGLALGYALSSGLVIRHPEQEHLVRVARRT